MTVAFPLGKATFLKYRIFTMLYVILTAIGVGGATVFGALLGFLFKRPSEKYGSQVLSFAVGVMLAASCFTLIIPSVEYSTASMGSSGVAITLIGIFTGAITLTLVDKVLPVSEKPQLSGKDGARREIMLFVIAIALHNLPEGLAAGVSFGSGDMRDTLLVAGSIALQNIPEGTVLISPMLSVGISPLRTFLIALSTGLVEVVGTFIGYLTINISTAVLPFALAFAGGTMLFVIADDMIPKTHGSGARGVTYALLLGFGLMVVFDALS